MKFPKALFSAGMIRSALSNPANESTNSLLTIWPKSRMSIAHWFLMLSLVGLVPGCYSPKSTVNFDSETDFTSLKTYAWTQDATDAFQIAVNAEHYVAAMDAELEAKGLKSVTDHADFSIHTHPVASHREGYESVRGNVDFPKAVIRVEFVNPKTGKPIWEGAVDIYISENAATEESEDAIHDAVGTLLESFPPTGRK